MKRCPECRKDYLDDSLLYCLDDGSELLQGSVTDEPVTAMLPEVRGARGSADELAAAERGGSERSRRLFWLGTALAVLLGIAAVGWSYGVFSFAKQQTTELSKISLEQLTNDPGYEGEPTFSPDGETIAYVSDRSGDFEIYIQQVSGGVYRNITEDKADDVQPAYSPDGKQIAFVSTRASASSLRWEGYDLPLMGGDIWVMPALGGNPRRVAKEGNFPSWSSDGSSIIYTGGPAFDQKIYRVSPLGGTPTEVIPKLEDRTGSPRFLLYPTFSANDDYIVFEADSPTGFGPRDIWVMRVDDGSVEHVAKGMCPKWNADSTAIIYSSAESGKNFSLWQRPFPLSDAHPPTPLTVGRGRDIQATAARDGRQIAFAGLDLSSNVEMLELDDNAGKAVGTPVPVTTGRQISYFQSPSNDGQVVIFESRQGFISYLWKVKRGGRPLQLTSDTGYEDTFPRLSPDERSVAFTRKRVDDPTRSAELWLMTSDGGNPHRLVENAGNMAWLGDSRGIVYFSYLDRQLYLFDLAKSESRQVTNEPNIVPVFAVTGDSTLIVFQSLESGTNDLKAISIDGGSSRRVAATPRQDYHPFISPTGRWLYFQPDHKNVYRVPGPAQGWAEAEPQKVTDFPESGLFLDDPQISGNGRYLLYTRGRSTGDIWLLKTGR